MMRELRFVLVVLVAASLSGCLAKAQVTVEADLPVLEPPPPPPRVVAQYPEDPLPAPVAPLVEATEPSRPTPRPPRPEAKPAAPEPQAPEVVPTRLPLPLTLTPAPGTEAKTAAAIRDLLARAARDLSRVNATGLNADGRAQFATASRFLEQAEQALVARNVVFAGKLADKAATMAAMLVR